MEAIKQTDNDGGKNSQQRQLFYVVTRDVTDGSCTEVIVAALDTEDAMARAVALRNQENGYGPDEDGGFEPVLAGGHEAILDILKRLADGDGEEL